MRPESAITPGCLAGQRERTPGPAGGSAASVRCFQRYGSRRSIAHGYGLAITGVHLSLTLITVHHPPAGNVLELSSTLWTSWSEVRGTPRENGTLRFFFALFIFSLVLVSQTSHRRLSLYHSRYDTMEFPPEPNDLPKISIVRRIGHNPRTVPFPHRPLRSSYEALLQTYQPQPTASKRRAILSVMPCDGC